jgi:hypothetical protein
VSAEALAHRAVLAAMVLGVLKVRAGLRVSVRESTSTSDVVVVTDAHPAMETLRARIADDGVVVLFVSSPVTRALIDVARDAELATRMTARDDAYARAIGWAAARADRSVVAPDLEPQGFAAIVESAAKNDLVLVEPEVAALSPALARVRSLRSPRARALLTTIALGAAARPLVFVPSRVAPKGGLARPKPERLVDSWVESAGPRTSSEVPTRSDLVRAALDVLDDAARSSRGPFPFKELLREARERWSAGARERGARATPSSADARELAASLYMLGAAEDILLYAVDPASPGWLLSHG